MARLLLLFAVVLSALADEPTTIPKDGSGKLLAGLDEVMLERPNFDFSHAPPKLSFTLNNSSPLSLEMEITVEVRWNSSLRCPGKYTKTWTGTVIGGATEAVIYDADLDKYVSSARPPIGCEAESIAAAAKVLRKWPSWLNQCSGPLLYMLPDGSTTWEDRHWRQNWPDTEGGDPHSELNTRLDRIRTSLGTPTVEQVNVGTASLTYIAYPNSPRRPTSDSETCSFRVVMSDGSIAPEHLSRAEEEDAIEPIKAGLARREAAEAERVAAAEAKRRKAVADRRKKEQEQSAELAKIRAAEDAENAAKAAKAKAACRVIYASTIDKKTGDLTVRETQQVAACQALGYYHLE